MEGQPPKEKTVKIAIDVEPERPLRRRRSPKDQCFYYFRKFIQFICSYIGLTSILVGYVFIGAVVFRSLEQPAEKEVAHVVKLEREQLLSDIQSECISNPVNWTDAMGRERLLKFEDELSRYITRRGYTSNKVNKWNFFGSLLFSLTVITTIGYGHITPVTWFGRVFCMLYALIGIPLMLLVLTNVGRLLANTAKLLYVAYTSKLCQQSRCYQRRRVARTKSTRGKPVKRKPPKKSTKKGTSKKKSNKKGVKKENAKNEELVVKRDLPHSASDVGPPASNKAKRKKRPASIATADIKMMEPSKVSRLAHYDRVDELLKGSPGQSGEEPSSVASSPARGLTIREAYAQRASSQDGGSASTPTSPQVERKRVTIEDETKSDTEMEIAKSEERTAEAMSPTEETKPEEQEREEKPKEELENKDTAQASAMPCVSTDKKTAREKGNHKKKMKKPTHRSRSETRTLKKDSYRSDSESESRTGSWQRKRKRRLSSPGTGSRPSSIASIYSLELKVMDVTTALKLANYNKPDWSSRDDLEKVLCEYSEDEKRSKSETPQKSKKSPKKPKGSDKGSDDKVNVSQAKGKPDNKNKEKDKVKDKVNVSQAKGKPDNKNKAKDKVKDKDNDSGKDKPKPEEEQPVDENEKESETKIEDVPATTDDVVLVVPEKEGKSKESKKSIRKRKSAAKKKASRKELKRRAASDPDLAPTQDIEEMETDFSEEERARRRNDEFEVPITPVLVLFLSYILIGAIIFSQLIEEWDIPTGIYFCFITLTTIGFGDFVPDDDLYSLVACTLYTMIGMAITSMCIALMIKKFVSSVRKFGRRIGIIKDEDEEHQYEDR